MQKSTSNHTLVQVVISLLQRDQITEALDWIMEAVLLGAEYGLEAEDVMRLKADKVIMLYNKSEPEEFVPPYLPQLRGRNWDRVIYGKAAFGEDDDDSA